MSSQIWDLQYYLTFLWKIGVYIYILYTEKTVFKKVVNIKIE